MLIVADENIPYAQEAFSAFGTVVRSAGRRLTARDLTNAEILLVRSVTRVNAELLQSTPVRFVGSATSGIDHVDIEYLQHQGIGFADAAGCNARSVAEYVVNAVLSVLNARGDKLAGRRVGIIGYGAVGTQVLRLFAALGCHCITCDPPRERVAKDRHYVSLAEALQADIVTLHVPLTHIGPDPTWQMLDASALELLQPRAVLVNAARGGIVDEQALLDHVKKHTDTALIIDCWTGEPAISPLLLRAAAVATPHIAGYSYSGKLQATAALHRALIEFSGQGSDWSAPGVAGPGVAWPEGTGRGLADETCLLALMRQCYNIAVDVSALRGTLDLDAAARAAAFDALRRDYSPRYEFADCELLGDAARTPASLRTVAARLGFE